MKAEERKKILSGDRPSFKGRKGGASQTDNPDQPAPPRMTFQDHVISWAKTIVTSLLIVMVVNGLLIASFVVPTGSMENEVMAGDFLFVNKFVYGGSSPQTIPFLDIPLPYFRLPGLRDPEKGDVIVFIFPGNREQVEATEFQYYLKRCVATAGDTLQVINKDVYINGKLQERPRNMQTTSTMSTRTYDIFPPGGGFTRDNWGPMRIPKEGDAIPLNDSTFGLYDIFFQREGHQVTPQGQTYLVDGKPMTEYKVERDYVFGMGDNRDNSLDSRFWGFIPMENVVGTPLMVYWSWESKIPGDIEQRDYSLGEKLQRIRWDRIFNIVK